MFKVVRKSESTVRKIADNKVSFNFTTREFSPEVSLTITEGKDYLEEEIAKYNRIYYVLEGELILNFNGEKMLLQAGDSCFVGKVVNQPAF